jgi:hypothetical protein
MVTAFLTRKNLSQLIGERSALRARVHRGSTRKRMEYLNRTLILKGVVTALMMEKDRELAVDTFLADPIWESLGAKTGCQTSIG